MNLTTAELVYRVAVNCLRAGNVERAQAHLRQLRATPYTRLSNSLTSKLIAAGITPCAESAPRRIESLENPT